MGRTGQLTHGTHRMLGCAHVATGFEWRARSPFGLASARFRAVLDLLRRNLPDPARIKILDRSIEMEADSEGDPLAEAWMYVRTFIPEE